MLVAGCGSVTAPKQDHTGGATQQAASATPPAGFNAVDACAAIDKIAMATIVGKPVAETALALVNRSDGTTAASSECTYLFEDGARATLMLRWSPLGDNSDGAIATARNSAQQSAKAFGGVVDTIEGVGKAAFWIGKIDSLNVFIGQDKFMIFNAPSGPAAKKTAIALARKLGA
jgi:hypothetical protein